MPARSGLCTRFLNLVSRSLSFSGRTVVARRAEKVKSSTEWLPVSLSDARCRYHRGLGYPEPRTRNPEPGTRNLEPGTWNLGLLNVLVPVVLRLIPLDELLHADGVSLAVAVALDGAGASGRLDVDVGKHEIGVDANRRDV